MAPELIKQSFHIPDNSDNDRMHVNFIISYPCENGKVLVVNMTTYRHDRNDASCILNIGDHSSIKWRSYISYHHAKILNENLIEEGVKVVKLYPSIKYLMLYKRDYKMVLIQVLIYLHIVNII